MKQVTISRCDSVSVKLSDPEILTFPEAQLAVELVKG